jgi:hypothetical protein
MKKKKKKNKEYARKRGIFTKKKRSLSPFCSSRPESLPDIPSYKIYMTRIDEGVRRGTRSERSEDDDSVREIFFIPFFLFSHITSSVRKHYNRSHCFFSPFYFYFYFCDFYIHSLTCPTCWKNEPYSPISWLNLMRCNENKNDPTNGYLSAKDLWISAFT